jgi:hypothetical protein
MKDLLKYIQFKPVFALTVTGLCFAYFFVKGVDNGIMVLCTLAAKHYFDSTASSVSNNKALSEAFTKQNPSHIKEDEKV